MSNVFVISALLFALMLFKTSNAFPYTISTPRTRYCRTIISYMMVECLPYFINDDNSQQPNTPCCIAVQSIAANDTNNCFCDIIIDNDDDSPMDLTKATNLPTICGVSPPCHANAPSPGPSQAPEDVTILYWFLIGLAIYFVVALLLWFLIPFCL
ncbi:Lipid transfer protein [Medicago truncatula]|uniref:Lipid transfer protein n=1 Tax=Medicago truncatula TaxID=3880 RepID=A0A072UQJ5_MEDTR|nr:Lipid transfer protein [Medicago truncatula]